MKTKILLTITAAFVICGAVFGQSLEQQFQEADAELNRVYKEVRSLLSPDQQKQLKNWQLMWIKENQVTVASDNLPSQRAQILIDRTTNRLAELRELLRKTKDGSVYHAKTHNPDPLADLRARAEFGDAGAQNNLGVCYANGQGVTKDIEEAVKWWQKAAEQGVAEAQGNLGVCYANGQGVAINPDKAYHWWLKSALQGNADAQNNLGVCYWEGQGVTKDTQEAFKWWKKAAEQGQADAQEKINFLNSEKSSPSPKSLKQKFQEADQELNRIYTELRTNLTEQAKAELTIAQREWIKKRDAYCKANLSKSESFKYQLTKQRAVELRGGVFKSPLIQENGVQDQFSNKGQGTLKDPVTFSPLDRVKVETIFQEKKWDDPYIYCEAQGANYRAVAFSNSNKIFIFDVKTKLLYGTLEGINVMQAEDDPVDYLCFCNNERYIYSFKQGYNVGSFKFTLLPTLEDAYLGEAYKCFIEGPFVDIYNNLGVKVVKGSEASGEDHEPTSFFFESSLDTLYNQSDNQSDDKLMAISRFAKKYPYLAKKIGRYNSERTNLSEPKNLPEFSAESLALNQEGNTFQLKSCDEFIKYQQKQYDKRREHVNKMVSHPRCSYKTVAANFQENSIILHNQIFGEKKETLIIDILNLTFNCIEWTGPLIIKSGLDGPYMLNNYGKNVFAPESGVINGVHFNSFSDVDGNRFMQLKIPSDSTTVKFPKQNGSAMRAFCYTSPINTTVAYWHNADKYNPQYECGIYNHNKKEWILRFNNNRKDRSFSEITSHFWDYSNGEMWVSHGDEKQDDDPSSSFSDRISKKKKFISNSISKINLNTGDPIQTHVVGKKFEVFALSEKRIFGMPRMDEKRGEIWDRAPLRKVCDIFWSDIGKPMIISDEGYYMSSGKSGDCVAFKCRDRAFPFEQFDLRLNRPDIVLERLGAPAEAIAIAKQLREKRLKRMGVSEDMLEPNFHLPEIEIVGDLPSSTAENELALKIKASDSKYPLDRLRVYVNNVPVNGKEGELLRDAKSQTLERTIPIKLAAGRNKIQVSVLNSAGAESLYANAEVTCTAQRPKPTLYAVAMGVSEYSNPDWNLKYAAKDATDILARIRSKSGSSYGEVKQLLLTDREVTKENLAKVREFLSKATVDDTVLMFVAGHGLLDSKYDYYFGTSDIDFENPSGKGIAFEEFDDLLAELPCLKKSLLIDTCHAGELDEDEKKALAAAQSAPTGQQVAMHPVGARGMSVKPIEGARGKSEWYDRLQGLFVDLRRGSGSTILSSSAGAEYALESSEQKNGLFTSAVLEALDGKEGSDANKDGSVTMSELAAYVKTRVATLTKNKQSPNVRRVNLEADFALSKK